MINFDILTIIIGVFFYKNIQANNWQKDVYVEFNFNGPGPSSFMGLPFGLITNANLIGTMHEPKLLPPSFTHL